MAWKSGFVTTNKINIHYTRTGGDKQPLILMHGVADDGLCWTPVARALCSDYDIIMVDARGHGRSDAPLRGYGPDMHAKDLAGLISKLQIKRPLILGHSMGAITTLTLAGTFPEIPLAILLEDPPHLWMNKSILREDDIHRAQIRNWMISVKRKTHQELLKGEREANPHWSGTELKYWADSKQRFSVNLIDAFKNEKDRSAGLSTLLSYITCPTLLITGDPARGAIVTPESASALQKFIPQAKVAHISKAGHSIRRDQFEKYLKTIRSFLLGSSRWA